MAKQSMPRASVDTVHRRSRQRCERCGTTNAARWSLHHRKPRGMGGTKDPMINSPANLLLLCGSGTEGCHGWVETHRTEAYEFGLLVHRNDDPESVCVKLMYGLVRLDDGGGVQPC
jgi:hypothetical protein